MNIFSSLKKMNYVFRGRIPGQIIIQYTDRCNAKCPQCSMGINRTFQRSKLNMDDVKSIIDHAAKNNVGAVSFTGGEPLLFFDEILELIIYAGNAGIPYIRTGTNGFIFQGYQKPNFQARIEEIAGKLSETSLYSFWISLDSAEPSVHEQMRGLPEVVKGIEKAIPVFHKYGIYPSVNLGLNRNLSGSYIGTTHPLQLYEEFTIALEKFFRFITDIGFTIANVCYPISVKNENNLNAVYGASASEHIVKFKPQEKVAAYCALSEVITEFRNRIRIFSPKSALYSLALQYSSSKAHVYACRGGKDFFFISAKNANTYPCGYRGNENFGKFYDLNLKNIGKDESCTSCDWECFRDPSELFGPFLDLTRSPLRFFKKLCTDGLFMKLWFNDLQYFKSCGFFNGRKPPDYKKLSKAV